jgi:hypothetical protein
LVYAFFRAHRATERQEGRRDLHHRTAKKESALPEWQTAIEVLMLCSRGGDPMMAKIGFMKALHRDRVREFRSDRKETHWGKRKLKRDQ